MAEDSFFSRWSTRKRSLSDDSKAVEEIIDLSANKLPERDIKNARDLVDHAEWGVAFELVCTQLHEVGAEVESELFVKIDAVGRELNYSPRVWRELDPAAASSEAEPEAGEEEAALLERLGLPVPETLKEGDDFTGFMAKGVPQFLRKRALRVLWRSNPVLANLDGLNDYDEDFNLPEFNQKVLATGYQVGRGFVKKVVEVIEGEEDSDLDEEAPLEEDLPVDNQIAENNSNTLEADRLEPLQPEPEDQDAPRPRRMRFET